MRQDQIIRYGDEFSNQRSKENTAQLKLDVDTSPVQKAKTKSEKPLSQMLDEIPDFNTADKKTAKAIVVAEKQKRKDYLAELEGQRKAADEQAYIDRRAKEFEEYNAKIEEASILGQNQRNRDAYLAELEGQRKAYEAQQELDAANTRLAGEFEQYRGEQIRSQQESDAIMGRKPNDTFGRFLETNPTTEQAIVANRAREVMNQ